MSEVITHEHFAVNGDRMAARLYLPDSAGGPFPAVVFYQGYRGRRKRYGLLARELLKHGIAALAFDFRGCGESEGDSEAQTIGSGLEDALAGYDFLADRPEVDSSRIGVLGVSYGAYLAAIVAAERPVSSLLLDAPAAYSDDWWDRSIGDIPSEDLQVFRNEANLKQTEPAKALQKYVGRLLLLRHEKDEQMPSRIAETYFESATRAAEKRLEVLTGLKHAMTGEKTEEFTRIVSGWFTETL